MSRVAITSPICEGMPNRRWAPLSTQASLADARRTYHPGVDIGGDAEVGETHRLERGKLLRVAIDEGVPAGVDDADALALDDGALTGVGVVHLAVQGGGAGLQVFSQRVGVDLEGQFGSVEHLGHQLLDRFLASHSATVRPSRGGVNSIFGGV